MAWKTVWVALAEWPPDHTEDILLCSKRQFALQYKILFTRKWGFSDINMVYIPLQVNKVKLLKCVERVILMIKVFLIRTDTKRCTSVLFPVVFCLPVTVLSVPALEELIFQDFHHCTYKIEMSSFLTQFISLGYLLITWLLVLRRTVLQIHCLNLGVCCHFRCTRISHWTSKCHFRMA